MDDLWKACIGAVAVLIVGGIYRFIKKRVKVKSAAQQEVEALKKEQDCIKEDVTNLKRAVPIIMKCLLALLVAAKDGKINGECDAALSDLNEYFISK
jgi:cell division protein FtsB